MSGFYNDDRINLTGKDNSIKLNYKILERKNLTKYFIPQGKRWRFARIAYQFAGFAD